MTPITPRELDVARLVNQGFSNREIAHRLGITEVTVKSHVHRLTCRLAVGSRTEIATWYERRYLTTGDQEKLSAWRLRECARALRRAAESLLEQAAQQEAVAEALEGQVS